MAKITKKEKRRLMLGALIFIPLLTIFLSSLFSYWSQIYKNIKDKKDLEQKYIQSLDEEEELKEKITKLQDPDYIARYAREKYLYSKDGEIIIKID